ncbi:MAG: hypothetical protein ACLQVJ_19435 [Syntrophobacteraceae bacterium]
MDGLFNLVMAGNYPSAGELVLSFLRRRASSGLAGFVHCKYNANAMGVGATP